MKLSYFGVHLQQVVFFVKNKTCSTLYEGGRKVFLPRRGWRASSLWLRCRLGPHEGDVRGACVRQLSRAPRGNSDNSSVDPVQPTSCSPQVLRLILKYDWQIFQFLEPTKSTMLARVSPGAHITHCLLRAPSKSGICNEHVLMYLCPIILGYQNDVSFTLI